MGFFHNVHVNTRSKPNHVVFLFIRTERSGASGTKNRPRPQNFGLKIIGSRLTKSKDMKIYFEIFERE